jgi:putative addiction module component (TIGR02574 family)
MTAPNAVEVLQEALELPVEDRLALATELLNSVEGPEDEDWAQAWSDELKRRLQEVERGEAKLVPWSEVRARITADLKRT